MAFVQAMNAPDTTKFGVNGAQVYTEEGVGDYRVTLFTMLNRGLEGSYIQDSVAKIFQKADPAEIQDLFVMAFQTRDVRGGKGERKLFTLFLKALFQHSPETVQKLLPLIPEYGCWRDLWDLVKEIPALQKPIFDLVAETFRSDLDKCKQQDKPTNLTLLAKWLPREGSGTYPGLAKRLADHLYAEEPNKPRRIIQYRKSTSLMNKVLKTVEVNMCGQTWAQIQPETVPGRCLKNQKKAFLNEPLKKKEEAQLRFPDSEDRMECRKHFLEFAERLKKGETKAKGANVVMPHELVEHTLYGSLTQEEHAINQGQWDAIREETLKLGGLGKCVPMCDFSGSMDGIPKLVSLALGILISEINHAAFKDHILTFDDEPQWHSFAGQTTLQEKLKSIGPRLGQGLSTDFYKAAMRILDKMREHKVPVGEEPEDLIVLTDMGFDAAEVHNYGDKRYANNWKLQLEQIRDQFKRVGEEIWGEGNGWKPPRMVIWNLRAEYKDFHAKADQEGVVQLSGWSPAVLKALQKGGVQVKTPYEGMRLLLDDPRYDAVREKIRA